MRSLALGLLLLTLLLSACQPQRAILVTPALPTAEPTTTRTAAPAPALTSTVTLEPEVTRYTSERFGVAFQVPEGFDPVGEDHFEGEAGFIRIEPFESAASHVTRACDWEANLHPEKYGDLPLLRYTASPEQPIAYCSLIPSTEIEGGEALMLFKSLANREAPGYGVLRVDREHADTVLSTFEIVLPEGETSLYLDELQDERPGVELIAPEVVAVKDLTFTTSRGPLEKLDTMREAQQTGAGSWTGAGLAAGFNKELERFGYRLMQADETGMVYALVRGDDLIEDNLGAWNWPIATSENDFALLMIDLDDTKGGKFLFRKDSRAVWTGEDYERHYWEPPKFAGEKLATIERAEDAGANRVVVRLEGEPVYTYSSSMYDYERIVLWSFNTWEDHWVINVNGTLIIDGEIINPQMGYGEVFGWQIFEGRPWFFFEKNGRYGISYGGEELPLSWDYIIHMECCGGFRNPFGPWLTGAGSPITFFAYDNGVYSFVEVHKQE